MPDDKSQTLDLVDTVVGVDSFMTWVYDGIVHLAWGNASWLFTEPEWEHFSSMVKLSEDKRQALGKGDVSNVHKVNMEISKRNEEMRCSECGGLKCEEDEE